MVLLWPHQAVLVVLSCLVSTIVCLSVCLSVTFPAVHEGGRDRRGGAIIIVRVDDKVDLGPLEVGKALLYLNQVPE